MCAGVCLCMCVFRVEMFKYAVQEKSHGRVCIAQVCVVAMLFYKIVQLPCAVWCLQRCCLVWTLQRRGVRTLKKSITHTDESCPIYEWVMSHIWASRDIHMNESCYKYEWGNCKGAEFVRVNGSCDWMHCVTRMDEVCHVRMNAWHDKMNFCHTYECDEFKSRCEQTRKVACYCTSHSIARQVHVTQMIET